LIWHGLQDGAAAEFERYHTVEHMPERLGIPGFVRGACETIFTSGGGVAGAACVLRLTANTGAVPHRQEDLGIACLHIGALAGVSGVHMGRHRPEIASAPTSETALRPKGPADNFDFVAVIEALDLAYLKAATEKVRAQFAQIQLDITGSGDYQLSYQLDSHGS
jgi:hypothetical protein